MISTSKSSLEKAEKMIEAADCDLNQILAILQNQLPVNLGRDEIPLRKELFDRTIQNLTTIPYAQFRLLCKDYEKLKHKIASVGLKFKNKKFEELKTKVDSCLQSLKQGEFDKVNLKEVDFEVVIADRKA